MGQLRRPDAVEDLIFALRDDFPTVSAVAARYLGNLGSEEAYQGLTCALPCLEGRARMAVAQALLRIEAHQRFFIC